MGSELIKVEASSQNASLAAGDLLVKVPVVLAEPTLTIPVDTTIQLPAPTGNGVLEVKTIGKRLKITQCLLALPTNTLFIKGFVRKDIQYAEITGVGTAQTPAVQSNIIDYTVDIGFSFTTDLTNLYITPPILPAPNAKTNFEYFKTSELPNTLPHSDKDQLLAGDLGQFDEQSTEHFNELPYCELVSATFTEYDEYLNRQVPLPLANTPFEEGSFAQLEEKMVIVLTLKVLQKQQRNVATV